jgi:hypothetical protein
MHHVQSPHNNCRCATVTIQQFQVAIRQCESHTGLMLACQLSTSSGLNIRGDSAITSTTVRRDGITRKPDSDNVLSW